MAEIEPTSLNTVWRKLRGCDLGLEAYNRRRLQSV